MQRFGESHVRSLATPVILLYYPPHPCYITHASKLSRTFASIFQAMSEFFKCHIFLVSFFSGEKEGAKKGSGYKKKLRENIKMSGGEEWHKPDFTHFP